MSAEPPSNPTAELRVGYIMTHYPRLAQTFIAGEIDAVERAGVGILPFAMNLPLPSEEAAAGAAARIARTVYLKPQLMRSLAVLIALLFRHPIGVARVAAMAIGSAGGSPTRMLRRASHLVQAALVAHEARRGQLAYLHAQFGLAPATIAWLASAFSAVQGERLPFGFTIHGFHDFVDPAESRIFTGAPLFNSNSTISRYPRPAARCSAVEPL